MTFRVASIRAFSQLAEGFKRPKDFDLARHWATAREQFEQALRPHRAEVLLSEAGCKRLAEAGAFAAQAVRDAQPAKALGWARVTLPYENPEQAARLLLSLGAEFKVKSPLSVLVAVRALCDHVLAEH